MIWVAPAYSAEVTVPLDRCVVLNSEIDNRANSRIAFHFTLPNELEVAEILFAELQFDLPQFNLRADSLLEFLFHPLLAEWNENDLDYENSVPITDSVATGSFILKLCEVNTYSVDITNYIRSASEGERPNFGLIAVANFLGDWSMRLPENLGGNIREAARVRVIYK
jgi:hypothetical protein